MTGLLLIEIASRSVAMGSPYVVWGGIDAIGTTAVGMLWFGEPATPLRLV